MSPRRPLPRSPEGRWLVDNRSLRLDANSTLFSESRRRYHLERYDFALPRVADHVVLDAACGTGYGSQLLSKSARHVTGVDLAKDTVAYATKTYGSDLVEFCRAPVEFLPQAAGSIDVVVSFETIEHTLCPRATLREFARVLEPGGSLILSAPNQWGLTKHHFFDFDVEQLRSLIRESFGRLELFYHNSGDWKNRTPPGIGPLGDIHRDRAECILAVCTEPTPDKDEAQHTHETFDEIYANARASHRQRILLERTSRGFAGVIGRLIARRRRILTNRSR